MATSRDKRDPARDQFEAILERALTAYHRDELHGGSRWIGHRMLDAELVPVTREAILHADEFPPDDEVLQIFDGEPMELVGEGYHVIALVEPGRRFVVKYAKHRRPVPPLARPAPGSAHEWDHDHGVRSDGSLVRSLRRARRAQPDLYRGYRG